MLPDHFSFNLFRVASSSVFSICGKNNKDFHSYVKSFCELLSNRMIRKYGILHLGNFIENRTIQDENLLRAEVPNSLRALWGIKTQEICEELNAKYPDPNSFVECTCNNENNV